MSRNPTPPITEGLVLAIIPAARSLLDWSGAGRDPTFAGAASPSNWIRQNGVYGFRAQGTGRLVVANDATLEAVTHNSLFVGGTWDNALPRQHMFHKRDVGGVQVVYRTEATSVFINDGAVVRFLNFGDWAGVRSFCVTVESGQIANAFLNGAFFAPFNGVTTITANDADIVLLNSHFETHARQPGTRALLWYNRVLTADEISDTAVFTDSLTSPTISPNRRYFDRGSWVPNGPQTSYGDSGPDLMTDGDMEAVGTAAWLEAGNPLVTKVAGSPSGSGSQALRVEYTGTPNPVAYQLPLVAGKRYRARGWARGDALTVPRIYLGSALVVWVGIASDTWQYFDATGVATGPHVNLHAQGTGAAEFDDITVEQTNNVLSDGMMEDGTTDEWTVVNNATLTKETGTPYEGTQVLHVAYNATTNPMAAQAVLVAGRSYRLTGRVRGDDASGLPRIYNGAIASIWVGTVSSTWQEFDITYTQPAGASVYFANNTNVAGYVEYDAVLLREVFETVAAYDLGVITGRECADKSSLGNHLTLSGNVAPVFTELGRAASFDGATGYGSAPYDASLKLADNGSIAFSVKPGSVTAGTRLLVNYGGQAGYATGYLIAQSTTSIRVYWLTGTAVLAAPTVLAVGEWARFILNNDNGTLTLYKNGASVGTGASGGAITANAATYIGGEVGDWYLDGVIKDVEIKNRIWTEAEIQADYAKLARTCLYYEDMSKAPPSVTLYVAGQNILGTEYTVASGTHDVNEELDGGRLITWIERVASGLYWRLQPFGHGAWEIDVLHQASTTQCAFINSQIAISSGSGYRLELASTGELGIVELGVGYLMRTVASYLTTGTRYKIRVTRATDGTFTLFIKGGTFADWTLVNVSGGSGTNPKLDNTTVTSTYEVYQLGTNARHYLDATYLGPVSPV